MTAGTGPQGIEARGVFAGFAAIGGPRRGEAMTLLVPAILGGFDRRRRIRIGHVIKDDITNPPPVSSLRPSDFMFQLADSEFANLKSQIAISSYGWGGRRHPPYAFTEQGVAMLSSVLKSKRAVHVNIAIMRAFVKLREMLSAHTELRQKLAELERKLEGHDGQIRSLFEAIRRLMAPPPKPKRIGFRT